MTNPKLKQTSLMNLATFEQGLITIQDPRKQAFLGVLFWTGCRLSEALALHRKDLAWKDNRIWIDLYHLKHTKQTDPFPAPRKPYLDQLEASHLADRLFTFSPRTAQYTVSKAFKDHYPHFFRMNRITQLLVDGATIPEIQSVYGLTIGAINRYLARVSVKRVDQILQKEALRQ